MSTHNICFRGEIRKISCGYPLLSVAMEGPDQTAQADLAFAVCIDPKTCFRVTRPK